MPPTGAETQDIETRRAHGRSRIDILRHPVADCPPTSTACAGMREQRRQTPQAATAEVHLDPAKSARFSGSVTSNNYLAASIPAAGTIYGCPRPPKGQL